jgi:hypothetical protein
MKPIQTALKYFLGIALLVLAAGCASNNLLDKENVAVAAGFKVITPTKPEQKALIQKLPADKVTPITYGGKSYYVLPDLTNNQLYVGGPKQYQAYQRLRKKQEWDAKNISPPPDRVEVVEVGSVNWGDWGGWVPDGEFGEPGWY